MTRSSVHAGPRSRGRLRKWAALAAAGVALYVLSMIDAPQQMATATECGTGGCSQTAASTSLFFYGVATVVSCAGLGFALIRAVALLATWLNRPWISSRGRPPSAMPQLPPRPTPCSSCGVPTTQVAACARWYGLACGTDC